MLELVGFIAIGLGAYSLGKAFRSAALYVIAALVFMGSGALGVYQAYETSKKIDSFQSELKRMF